MKFEKLRNGRLKKLDIVGYEYEHRHKFELLSSELQLVQLAVLDGSDEAMDTLVEE